MKTSIFAHRGYIGIESSVITEGLLNDPFMDNSIKVDASKVLISKEAVDLFKAMPKGKDQNGLKIKLENGVTSIEWPEVTRLAIDPRDTPTTDDFNPTGLVASEEAPAVPQGFIDMVDEMLDSAAGAGNDYEEEEDEE